MESDLVLDTITVFNNGNCDQKQFMINTMSEATRLEKTLTERNVVILERPNGNNEILICKKVHS